MGIMGLFGDAWNEALPRGCFLGGWRHREHGEWQSSLQIAVEVEVDGMLAGAFQAQFLEVNEDVIGE